MMPSIGQSAASLWEQTFSTILGKALREATPPHDPLRARPATLNFTFGGGGIPVIPPVVDPNAPSDPNADPTLGESLSLVTTTDVQIVEIPFPCKVAWCHLWAFDSIGSPFVVTSAVFDLWITQYVNFGGRVPMYGLGQIPALVNTSKDDMNLTGWNTFLNTGDAVQCRLASITGSASTLAVTLLLLPTEAPENELDLEDDDGNFILDEAGNRVVFRAYEDAGGAI